MIDVIKKQLDKVQYADLSNFDKNTNTYLIKKRVDIKLELDNCYLIRIKPSAHNNAAVVANWNNGSMPAYEYLKVDISKLMGKMVKLVGVGHDYANHQDLGYFWSGWLSTDDIEILAKL